MSDDRLCIGRFRGLPNKRAEDELGDALKFAFVQGAQVGAQMAVMSGKDSFEVCDFLRQTLFVWRREGKEMALYMGEHIGVDT